jgi:hypothetical protein
VVVDENNIYPFASRYPNVGARLRSETLLLSPSLLNPGMNKLMTSLCKILLLLISLMSMQKQEFFWVKTSHRDVILCSQLRLPPWGRLALKARWVRLPPLCAGRRNLPRQQLRRGRLLQARHVAVPHPMSRLRQSIRGQRCQPPAPLCPMSPLPLQQMSPCRRPCQSIRGQRWQPPPPLLHVSPLPLPSRSTGDLPRPQQMSPCRVPCRLHLSLQIPVWIRWDRPRHLILCIRPQQMKQLLVALSHICRKGFVSPRRTQTTLYGMQILRTLMNHHVLKKL